jgi:glycosyltransferase involved in cell wall biosynthesis
MLRAVSLIEDEIPVHLSLYGSGDFLPQALQLAGDLGLGEKVYFSSAFFPVETIPGIVSGRDLGVIGNRRTLACEEFMLPVKLLEYVYLGIPVVAPRLKIIKQYFDEDMIKYYEPDDADDLSRCIVELYRSPGERARLVSHASRFYRHRSWSAQAAQYLLLLSGRLESVSSSVGQPERDAHHKKAV